MKPRVLFSDGTIRVVRGRWFFYAEQAAGKDHLGKTRWVDIADPAKSFGDLVRSIGKTLVRREKGMRKARRAGK